MLNADRNSAPELLKDLALGLGTITSFGHACLPSAIYTECLIMRFAEMGRNRGYDAHPDPTRVGFYKEYLFDSSWWSGSELVLAAESEWGEWRDVAYDFPKLLVAKAPLKILITDAGSHGSSRERFKSKLEQMLQIYPRHFTGERYLWIDVNGNLKGGDLFGFEATIAKDGKCTEVPFLPTSPESFSYEFKKGS
jgi:hypothetical protein